MLERSVVRIERYLRRRGLLRSFDEDDEGDTEADPEGHLAASAVSGQAPPGGRSGRGGLRPWTAIRG